MLIQEEKHVVLKIFRPEHSPQAHEPLLTLHTTHSTQFFIEALSHGLCGFDKQFATTAWLRMNDLIEREVAYGVFVFKLEEKTLHLHTLSENGMREPEHANDGIITAAFTAAIARLAQQAYENHG